MININVYYQAPLRSTRITLNIVTPDLKPLYNFPPLFLKNYQGKG